MDGLGWTNIEVGLNFELNVRAPCCKQRWRKQESPNSYN